MNEQTQFEPDDLHWLAFCYVADEMTSVQRAAFEQRLAEDQTARQAVARAVELAHCVYLASSESRQASNSAEQPAFDRLPRAPGAAATPKSTVRSWLPVAATVVCIALAVFWITRLSPHGKNPPRVTQDPVSDVEALAVAWVDALDLLANSGSENMVGEAVLSSEMEMALDVFSNNAANDRGLADPEIELGSQDTFAWWWMMALASQATLDPAPDVPDIP